MGPSVARPFVLLTHVHIFSTIGLIAQVLTFEQGCIKFSKSPVEIQPQDLCIPPAEYILNEVGGLGMYIIATGPEDVIHVQ